MRGRRWKQELGPPDIRLGGLQIWVHTPPGPVPEDSPGWSWLRVTAHYAELGASVWVSGEILTVEELEGWQRECTQLLASPQSHATLACAEPYLDIEINPEGPAGRLAMTVHITPNHALQTHRFVTEIEREAMTAFVHGLEAITRSRTAGPGRRPR